MDLEQIDALINWKLTRHQAAAKAAKEGTQMQDQITIELRVDFADKEKIPELIKLACSMARTLVANVQLLGPTTKPECTVFTDNFIAPPLKIDIFSDLIAKGQAQLAAAGDTALEADQVVSQEMLDAMKG